MTITTKKCKTNFVQFWTGCKYFMVCDTTDCVFPCSVVGKHVVLSNEFRGILCNFSRTLVILLASDSRYLGPPIVCQESGTTFISTAYSICCGATRAGVRRTWRTTNTHQLRDGFRQSLHQFIEVIMWLRAQMEMSDHQ